MKNQFHSVIFLSGVCWAPLSIAQPQLEEVIVTSSRIETPVRQVGAAVSVVQREEIELRGYDSVPELLRTQPGVAVSNSGGAGKATSLRIRGEEGYRTLVMVDGVDISDPTGTQVGPQIQFLGAGADIEQIEILRGPQGFIYGADAGGVVNIITRRSEGLASELSVEAGRYDSQNVQGFIAAGDQQLDAFISINQQSTDGFNSSALDTDNEADSYQNTTLHGKFGVRFDDHWRSQLVLRSTDASSEYDRCGFPYSNDCYSDFKQTIAKLSFHYEQNGVTQSVAIARTGMERDSFAMGEPSFDANGSVRKIEYLGSVKLNPIITLVWGGDAENEDITGTSGDSDKRDQYGIYTEWQNNVNDAFYLSVGARYDDNQDFGDHLSARVAPAWVQELSADYSLKFRASWGTGFRAPSLSEIFYNRRDDVFAPAADVILQEETSEGFDVGVEFYGDNGLTLQLGYFDQQVENEIYFDLDTYSGYLQGQGISHSKGGELAFEVPVTHSLSLQGNYTYNDTLTGDDERRARRPRHLANLTLQSHWLNDQLKVLLNIRHSADSLSTAQDVKLDDYSVVDISTQYQPLKVLTLFARMINATDRQYQEVNNYNTAGRAVYAGIKYSF